MSISTFVRNCAKNTTGLDYAILVAPFRNINSVTFSGETLTGITMSGANFSELQADWDSVSLSTEGTTARSSSHTSTLTASFSHADATFTAMLRSLQTYTNCGLVLIFRNGAGKWFISGIDPADRQGGSRPYMSLTHNYTSGEGVAAEDGNAWTLSFAKTSGEVEFYEISTSLASDLIDKSATWVDWA